MSELIRIKDKQFRSFISADKIKTAVLGMANKINSELVNDFPVFLVVLNGSFVFAADLLREVTIPCEISFIKLASYNGTSSSGTVTELIGLNENVSNRTIVIVEDIVDTGITIELIVKELNNKQAKTIRIATALFKPEAYKKEQQIHYVGFEIQNDFVIGYGLDYDGLGRNLKDIYVLTQ